MSAFAAQVPFVQLLLETILKAGREIGVIDVTRIKMEQLFAGVAEAAARGRVGLQNVAVGIVDKNGVVDGLEKRAPPVTGMVRLDVLQGRGGDGHSSHPTNGSS